MHVGWDCCHARDQLPHSYSAASALRIGDLWCAAVVGSSPTSEEPNNLHRINYLPGHRKPIPLPFFCYDPENHFFDRGSPKFIAGDRLQQQATPLLPGK
jgi:hypothetical protein